MVCINDYQGTSITINTVPGRAISWWVHPANPTCGPQAATVASFTIPACPTPTNTPVPPTATPTRTPTPPPPTPTPTRTPTPIPPTATRTPTQTPPSATATSIPATPTPKKLGDVDGDGHINIADFNEIIGFFGRSQTNPYLDADLDKSGQVWIEDFNEVVANFEMN